MDRTSAGKVAARGGVRVRAQRGGRTSDPGRRVRTRAARSAAEIAFEQAWRLLPPLRGVELESEFVFHPSRKWRFDFALPPFKVAVEIDGRAAGDPSKAGRHQTVDGVRRDLEKHRAALLRGWRVMRYPSTDKAQALAWAREVRELLRRIDPVTDECAVCACTDADCSGCIERTGEPCYWARSALCSACADRQPRVRAASKRRG